MRPIHIFNNFSRFEAAIFAVDWRQLSRYNYRPFLKKIEGFIRGGIGGFCGQIFRASAIKIFNSSLNYLMEYLTARGTRITAQDLKQM